MSRPLEIDEEPPFDPTSLGFLPADKVFRFKITLAGGLSPAACQQAEIALQSAGERIAREILFKKEINVNVEFDPKLIEPADGWASGPIPLRAAGGDSKALEYPCALVKQTNMWKSAEKFKSDINLAFKSTLKWNFKPKTFERIGNQYDLEFFAVRALTNGLGFEFDMVDLKSEFPSMSHFITPVPTSSELTSYAKVYNRLFYVPEVYPSVFANLMYGKNSFGQLGTVISDFFNSNSKLSPEQFAVAVRKNSTTDAAGKEMYRMLREDTIYLKCHDGDSIQFQRYESMQEKMKYVYQSYSKGAEFLMAPLQIAGDTVDNVMAIVRVKRMYGPKTRKVLETMGYSTRERPQVLQLKPVKS